MTAPPLYWSVWIPATASFLISPVEWTSCNVLPALPSCGDGLTGRSSHIGSAISTAYGMCATASTSINTSGRKRPATWTSELVPDRPDRRELRHVDDEDGQLDDVGPVGAGSSERTAHVRERRPCLFLPAVRQVPVGVDRHLTGRPHEAAGREGDDMAVAVRPRKIVGRGEGGCHVAGRTSISAGSSSGSSAGSSSCFVRASKYMYAVTSATKGMVDEYTTPATIFSSASGASVRRISSAPRSGPAAIATAVPTPTREATFSQRPRTSSPLRRKASTAR